MDYIHILTCMDGLCHPPFFFFFTLSSFVFSNFLLLFSLPLPPLRFISLFVYTLCPLFTSQPQPLPHISYIMVIFHISSWLRISIFISNSISRFFLLVSTSRLSDFDFDYGYGFLYALCALASFFLSI